MPDFDYFIALKFLSKLPTSLHNLEYFKNLTLGTRVLQQCRLSARRSIWSVSLSDKVLMWLFVSGAMYK